MTDSSKPEGTNRAIASKNWGQLVSIVSRWVPRGLGSRIDVEQIVNDSLLEWMVANATEFIPTSASIPLLHTILVRRTSHAMRRETACKRGGTKVMEANQVPPEFCDGRNDSSIEIISVTELADAIRNRLSLFQIDVFELALMGMGNFEISKKLACTVAKVRSARRQIVIAAKVHL